MKKYALLLALLLCISITNFSQYPNQQVVATSGDSYKNSNFQLDWSLGELQTETYYGTEIILTQGFNQADYIPISKIENSKLEPGISIFPNPAIDYIQVKIEDLSITNLHYFITNLLGKKLVDNNLTNSSTLINLNTYEVGTYFIIITQNNKIFKIFKIIRI
jgi:hypothetical protein